MNYFFAPLKLFLRTVATLYLSIVVHSVHASDVLGNIGLIAGSKTGTYIRIANDIATLAKTSDLDVTVYESNGSLENIAAVFEREDIQLGLVQSDVLGYLQESQNRKLERVAQQIVMMLPLYNEEVHLLAKKDILNITDLNHTVVAVGNKGSGTNLTAELLMEITDVWPQKKYLLADDEALKKLNDGEIDALFYVSGYPISLLEDIDSSRFHLVSLNNVELIQYYVRSAIPELTYAWQKEKVDTVAVKAVLMTAGFHHTHCDSINRLISLVRDNIGVLRENGHSKWKEVDLDFTLDNWVRRDCFRD